MPEARMTEGRPSPRHSGFVIDSSFWFLHSSFASPAPADILRPMQYRRLGSTRLRVSVVGMGTWQFGGEWGKDFSQDEADRMLGRAKDLGINLLDTAECYGDHTS